MSCCMKHLKKCATFCSVITNRFGDQLLSWADSHGLACKTEALVALEYITTLVVKEICAIRNHAISYRASWSNFLLSAAGPTNLVQPFALIARERTHRPFTTALAAKGNLFAFALNIPRVVGWHLKKTYNCYTVKSVENLLRKTLAVKVCELLYNFESVVATITSTLQHKKLK